MTGERTNDGWAVRLRPRGVGRFFSAGFLLVWLTFWSVGELVVGAVMGTGLYGLLTSRPVMGAEEPLNLGMALGVGVFLATWFAFWTFGGLMALRELLRLLWSQDRMLLQPQGLTLHQNTGPWRTVRHLARADIVGVYIRQHQAVLMLQTRTQLLELSTLGTVAERREAAALLRQAFALPMADGPVAGDSLPAGWQEAVAPDGAALLVPELRARRVQARVLAGFALAAWIVALLLVRETLRQVSYGAVAAMVLAAAGWLAWKTVWLYRGRKEWRLDAGLLLLQRRFGGTVSPIADIRRLELTETTDGDGDHWYELAGVDESRAGGVTGRRHTLLRCIHDSTDPRLLGQWLARRAQVAFDDRVPTAQARAADLASMRDALARTGALGRWVGRSR